MFVFVDSIPWEHATEIQAWGHVRSYRHTEEFLLFAMDIALHSMGREWVNNHSAFPGPVQQ